MDSIAAAAFGLDANTFKEENPIFQEMGKKLQFSMSFKLIATLILQNIAPKLAIGKYF